MKKPILSILTIVLVLIFGLQTVGFSQSSPTRSDKPISGAEIQKILQEYAPQVGRSNLAMPSGFENIQNSAKGGQKSVLDSKGTEFWLMFMNNQSGSDVQLFFDITSDENTSGIVEIPGFSITIPFTVTANTVTRVTIPSNLQFSTSGVVGNYGIHVTSEKEITVYGMSKKPFTTDGFLGLPIDIISTQYLVMTYPGLNWGGFGADPTLLPQFSIVSPYDNNVITITPRDQTFNGNPAGVPFSVTLNKGQTYMVRGRLSNAYSADQTGSIVESTLPVSVFSGNGCASVPQNVPACDHIVEQIPPLSTWGKSFISRQLEGRLNGDTWRFLAAQDNTELSINGTLVATLDFGDFYETVLTLSAFIESTKPVLAVQFANGDDWDYSLTNNGDPFMMVVPPYEQFLDGYTFATPGDGFDYNYFTSTVATDAVSGMTLNGSPINPALFSPVATSSFSAAGVPVNIASSYNISNSLNSPFGLYSYGFSSYVSYGYPGGLSLVLINAGSGPVIELTDATVSSLFCTNISTTVDVDISALITDADEPFVQSATVYFRTIGTATYQSMPLTPGLGNVWSATISSSATDFPGLEFYITATDGQTSTTSPSVDPANNPYSIGIGNIPPDITHTPVLSAPIGNNVPVSAEVIDVTSSVQSVTLFYRIAGGTPFYSSLPMNNTGGDSYEAVIPGGQMTVQGIEYYIRATDNFGVSCYYGLADSPLFITGTSSQNVAPVASGFPIASPSINVGETYLLSVQFASPEVDQITDVVVNDGGLAGFSAIVTPGNTASVDIQLDGLAGNVGTHTITFVATDNGTPSLSTTVELQITVIEPIVGQWICMPQGWSGISSYNDPYNPNFVDIFADLVADDKVVIILGESGFYWPSQNINLLNDWDVFKGYKIKMNAPGCIAIDGEMPEDKTFNVKRGTNYIPVLCDEAVDASSVLSQLGADFLYAFDIQNGLVYWPTGGIFTLETLQPGVGYLVAMTGNGSATYNCGTKSSFTSKTVSAYTTNSPWNVNRTGDVHLISIASQAISDLHFGDFIGVFTNDGVCAGVAEFKGNGNILLVAFGDDATTSEIDGLTENSALNFRVFRPSTQSEFAVNATYDVSLANQGQFEINGQSKVIKMTLNLTALEENAMTKIDIFPNPGNGRFNIQIDSPSQINTIQVMSMTGKTVYNQSLNSQSSNNFVLDLSNLPKGVYFVKFISNGSSMMQKIVIQ